MSAPVDVLAVMDAEMVTLRRLESWVNASLAPTSADADGAIAAMAKARAAVAALIEAAGEINYDMEHLSRDDNDDFLELHMTVGGLKRLHAALTRIGGAA